MSHLLFPPSHHSLAPRAGEAVALLPGLVACAAVAALAFALRRLPLLSPFSPMIIAIGLGMILRNTIGTTALLRPGIAFAMRRLLRAAVVLLGLQLTLAQVVDVGIGALVLLAAAVAATFLVTLQLGRWLGVDARLTQLIAAGTSICGASAVAAANSVVEADDEDVTYAVACVTVFGSLAMFGYPLIGRLIGLDGHDFGLWAGASIHEIAQVVAATFSYDATAGTIGTIAKLTRVMMLAPVVFAMAGYAARRSPDGGARARPPLPIFVFGFMAMVLLSSLIAIPAGLKEDFSLVSTGLLTMALAAMGLETSLIRLAARGLRPALLGAAASLFIAVWSLALIRLV